MALFHITTRATWEQDRSGLRTTGLGVDEPTCSREQVAEVWREHWSQTREPLVLLTVDPERRSVVDVRPLDRRGGTASFLSLFLGEMMRRVVAACVVMLASVVAALIAERWGPDWAPLVAALVTLVVGGALSVWWLRRPG